MNANRKPSTGFLDRFGRHKAGQVAVIFALCGSVLVMSLGGGLDLARAFVSRQKLSNAAALTCQYSARPTVVSIAYNGGNGAANYVANVDSFATNALSGQNFQYTQTTAAPFAWTAGGTSSVNMTASVPTIFAGIVGVNSIPIAVSQSCNNGQTEPTGNQSSTVLTESFENAACSGTCWGSFQPNGKVDQLSATPTNTFPTTAGYVGLTGTQWTIMGYCLEVDTVGQIMATVADGTHSAELDCDNGSDSAGNSSISNLSYYAAGTYELRYSYSGRVNYPNYNPAYICGTTAADVAWANDTTTSSSYHTTAGASALRTNQINVYFDPNTNGAAPTHTTMDGTQTLGGSDLIDMCVYSANWVQRSVKITISTAGYYWLSFAADGANDSYGGQLDNIMVCRTACSGSVNDNFPSAWSNALLFEDTFESPTYSGGANNFNGNGLLGSSYGTTSTGAGGWPGQSSVGWSVGPYNEIGYLTKYSDQGTQSIQLDNYNPVSGQTTTNRTIARPFYLDPGYYKVTYDYVSDAVFSSVPGQYCTYAPTGSLSAYAYSGMLAYTNRSSGATGSVGNDTNSLAVFMAHTALVSTPNVSTTLNATTTYTNPDGSVTTTPTAAPDALTLSSYNGSQVNPVLDYCAYSGSWMTRTTYVKITKPGEYWLIFAGKGSADAIGAAIDDVRLTALNSLYGSASSFFVTIPTPSATPGSTISYTGFSIVADPLTP